MRAVAERAASTVRGLTLHQRTAVVLALYAVLLLGFRLSGHGKPDEARSVSAPENEPAQASYFPSYLFPTHSHSSDLAQLDAEARLQDALDEKHDRDMARIGGTSVEQEKAMGRAGIVRTTGSDSFGKIGTTLAGETIRTDSDGRQQVLENGRWYER